MLRYIYIYQTPKACFKDPGSDSCLWSSFSSQVCISMLASLPLCLVGWCWSVGWGISLLNIASNNQIPKHYVATVCMSKKWFWLQIQKLQISKSDEIQKLLIPNCRQAACLWGKGADTIAGGAAGGILAKRSQEKTWKTWCDVSWAKKLFLVSRKRFDQQKSHEVNPCKEVSEENLKKKNLTWCLLSRRGF